MDVWCSGGEPTCSPCILYQVPGFKLCLYFWPTFLLMHTTGGSGCYSYILWGGSLYHSYWRSRMTSRFQDQGSCLQPGSNQHDHLGSKPADERWISLNLFLSFSFCPSNIWIYQEKTWLVVYTLSPKLEEDQKSCHLFHFQNKVGWGCSYRHSEMQACFNHITI